MKKKEMRELIIELALALECCDGLNRNGVYYGASSPFQAKIGELLLDAGRRKHDGVSTVYCEECGDSPEVTDDNGAVYCGCCGKQVKGPKVTIQEITITAELLNALAPEEPMNQDEQGGCVWCDGREKGGSYARSNPEDHFKDCPWVLARNILSNAVSR